MRLFCSGQAAISIITVVLLYPYPLIASHSDGISPYGNGYAPDVVHPDNRSYEPYESPSGTDLDPNEFDNLTVTVDQSSGLDRRAAKDFYLRVMPLGASITQGYKSSDGNGYRKWLRAQLRFRGWKVNMVGSERDGTMADSDNEGHPGWTVESVHGAWTESKWMKPNLVLINAGLNDCNSGGDPSKAGERTKSLVDDIFDSVPGVTVVLSTLLLNKDSSRNSCTDDISKQIRKVAAGYKGARIALADVRSVMSMDDIGPDKDHPTDDGYKMFAGVWWDAISKIEDQIQAPAKVDKIDDAASGQSNQCKKVAGNAGLPGQSQMGSGHDDGNYVHQSTSKGVIESAKIDKGSDPKSITDAIPWHIFFANIVKGDPNAERTASLDDWIRVYHNTKDKNAYWFRQNLGGGKFDKSVQFNVDMDCDLGPRYAFADFNNDGLDDFFCIKEKAVWVSLNRGGNPPKFESMGQVIGGFDGLKATDVRIADIDGDGRADFCLVKSAGEIVCSRNGGWGDKPQWQGFSTEKGIRGTVFDIGQPDKSGIILADLNGDFRSDVMYIGDHGQVSTWINNRGTGSGIVPKWRSAGQTHAGQAVTGIQDSIKFGRIYGSNRLDYIFLKEEKDHFDVVVWQNQGAGGTKLKADGNYYCDMRGSGSDDYVWIYQDGHAAEINVNIHSPPAWGHNTRIELTVPGPRNGIHLADWTGDGRCDVIVQNKATGYLTVYKNQYDKGADKISFGSGTTVATDCNQGWGVGIFDLGMRFHDIDGDGLADALCIEKNGRITGWLNKANGLENVGQVKFSEGWDRANIRFADVEASGRADLLHVDKYTGAVDVFTNNGHKAQGGSSFSWTKRGMLYNPIDRGENMHFTNQGGQGRADLVKVDPQTNKAWTYWNRCSSTGGDDSPPTTDPGLPKTGGGSVGDDIPIIDLPGKGEDHSGEVCGYTYQTSSTDVMHKTWKESGSADWWDKWIHKNGAEAWSDHFFMQVMNQPGGSTFDCNKLSSDSCGLPEGKNCSDYIPPQGFYMHFQIANLFNAFRSLWMDSVENAIEQLSSGIKTIVQEYGTPPHQDNGDFLNMLVGILTSLAGFGAEKALFTGTMTSFAGIFASMSAGSSWETTVSPETLNEELEMAYGDMFRKVMNSTKTFVPFIFNGSLPKGWNDKQMTEYVYDFFKDGDWLSKDITSPAIDHYLEQVRKKWNEFAVVKAMKSRNKADYFLMVSDHHNGVGSIPTHEDMSEQVCKDRMEGCIWHDKRCICFGSKPNGPGSISGVHNFQGDDLKTFKGYVFDYEAALKNNYDCVKYRIDNPKRCVSVNGNVPEECNIKDATVPDHDDMDITNPIEYTKCWFNLAPLMGDQYICGWTEN
ncbi:Multidomain esterase [Fusarium oxysporum f. sp. rapae]|uniref:Multidomain esterase n=1 Tax=Fusarium oxysporum f. sp. rapae TaxID=485398 RepID=A0A8J5NQ31_FUSOX|nr:Multidomain esterase [Fusarium oxysporum f. sp. rapae]